MKDAGVYAIRCLVNGKVYVGSTSKSFDVRWKTHRGDLRRGKHDNRHLQAAWDKYGESSFEFIVVERCHPGDCIAREQHWINSKRASERGFGFNLSPTAGNCLGVKHSPETRAKMSAAHANPTPEYRILMSIIKRGEIRSPETRAKMSASRLGIVYSQETRDRIGAASRGRRHSDEAKAKMSAAGKGRVFSDEHRRAISEGHLKRAAELRAAAGDFSPRRRRGEPIIVTCDECGTEFRRINKSFTCSKDCSQRRSARLNRERAREYRQTRCQAASAPGPKDRNQSLFQWDPREAQK